MFQTSYHATGYHATRYYQTGYYLIGAEVAVPDVTPVSSDIVRRGYAGTALVEPGIDRRRRNRQLLQVLARSIFQIID
jgi:hypothetical protein